MHGVTRLYSAYEVEQYKALSVIAAEKKHCACEVGLEMSVHLQNWLWVPPADSFWRLQPGWPDPPILSAAVAAGAAAAVQTLLHT